MPSIFSQEWRDCLRAHYAYVVRMGDHGTEKTLHHVMIEAGFREDEVKELYVLATAHVDDVDADFVPDMDIFAEETASVAVVVPEISAEVLEIVDAPEFEDGEVTAEAVEAELDEAGEAEEAAEAPPSAPDTTQLSLF